MLDAAPASPEGVEALRLLLEGAMADATTPVSDAQDVMELLKALGTRKVDPAALLAP
jgi:hypothetical protein